MIKQILNKIGLYNYPSSIKTFDTKYNAELMFWEQTLKQYVDWYQGKIKTLYKEKNPTNKQKIKVKTLKDSAILTWEKIHQQTKYLEDLKLSSSAFKGKKILDIGAGPHPSARVFKGSKLYCLDPLLPEYIKAGFPIHYYEEVKYIYANAESIPLKDHSIDVIISVNALDHVDDFEGTANEIRRVLSRNGKLRFHLHYHKATTEEPIELTDERVLEAYSWSRNFHKISESNKKRGTSLKNRDEKYVLWSNF